MLISCQTNIYKLQLNYQTQFNGMNIHAKSVSHKSESCTVHSPALMHKEFKYATKGLNMRVRTFVCHQWRSYHTSNRGKCLGQNHTTWAWSRTVVANIVMYRNSASEHLHLGTPSPPNTFTIMGVVVSWAWSPQSNEYPGYVTGHVACSPECVQQF